MFHALESIFDHSWEIGWDSLTRRQSHTSLPLRTLPLHFVTICIAYPIRTLPIKYGCILLVRIRIYIREKGDVSLGDRGRGHVTRVWQRWIYPGRGRDRVTDGEPHVMASPVRLIAPLYQIHPRLARGCGPGHVDDDVVSPNIRVRSVDPFSLSTVTWFFSSISLHYFRNFIWKLGWKGYWKKSFTPVARSIIGKSYFLSVERHCQKLIFGNQISRKVIRMLLNIRYWSNIDFRNCINFFFFLRIGSLSRKWMEICHFECSLIGDPFRFIPGTISRLEK